MHIQLVSSDSELCRVCREALPEGVAMSTAAAEHLESEADLYLIDFDAALPMADAVRQNRAKALFLVDRADLPAFGAQMTEDATILLKPVVRGALAVFLEAALAGSVRPVETMVRLQEYDRERTNFLARAVHDFRAPLTALSGYCGLLLDGPLGGLKAEREVLERMQNSIDRLTRMASAMSLMCAGQRAKIHPAPGPGDLAARLEQALHETARLARDKNIAIARELAPCGELYFDTDQIEQVFVNLLDNACRFTPRSGSIEIRGYRYFWDRRNAVCAVPPAAERRCREIFEPNTYRVDVRDSGPLIPESNLHRIFEEYTSFAGADGRLGSGLGLAICRTILSNHGGRIWAENTGAGPVFSFVLPLQRVEVPPPINGTGVNRQLMEIGAL